MNEPLLLLANVGNTHTTLALYRAGRIVRRTRLPTRAPGSAQRAALAALTRGRPIAGAALCSVVPARDAAWTRLLERAGAGRPHRVGPDSPLGIRVDVPRPAGVGADRLANAAAAAARYGAPAIVVDCGTATAVTLIARGRGFVGGAIAPGPALFYEYLADRTARLPRLSAGGAIPPFGRTTVAAMRLGAEVGYPGMVRALLEHLRRVPEFREARVVVTGGGGARLAAALGGAIILDRDLTLLGIGRIAERVVRGECRP